MADASRSIDYQADQMAEYVVDMSVRLVSPGIGVQAPFRKFISQILNSTRLPGSTVLMAMHYLAVRMTKMAAGGPLPDIAEGHVWRLTVVSLILASKYLDDNTFQNRSWADVSGICLEDLNRLEIEWLFAVDHSVFAHTCEGSAFDAWILNWKEWEAMKHAALDRQRERANEQARERYARAQFAASTAFAYPHDGRPDVHPAPYAPCFNGWYDQSPVPARVAASAHHSPDYMSSLATKLHEPAAQQPHQQGPPQYYSRGSVTPPDSGYSTPEYATAGMPYHWVPPMNGYVRSQVVRPIRNQVPARHQTHVHSQIPTYQVARNQPARSQAAVYNQVPAQAPPQIPAHQVPAHNAYQHAQPRNVPRFPPGYNNDTNAGSWRRCVVDCSCRYCLQFAASMARQAAAPGRGSPSY